MEKDQTLESALNKEIKFPNSARYLKTLEWSIQKIRLQAAWKFSLYGSSEFIRSGSVRLFPFIRQTIVSSLFRRRIRRSPVFATIRMICLYSKIAPSGCRWSICCRFPMRWRGLLSCFAREFSVLSLGGCPAGSGRRGPERSSAPTWFFSGWPGAYSTDKLSKAVKQLLRNHNGEDLPGTGRSWNPK